jgi:hypothetical protein
MAYEPTNRPFLELRGDALIINLDASTSSANPSSHLEQLGAASQEASDIAARLPLPGQATEVYLEAIAKEGWEFISQPPYGRTLEIKVEVHS